MNTLDNCKEILKVMKKGGFYNNIMESDSKLDRVKAYLVAFEDEKIERPLQKFQYPTYPCFPGLNQKPFHNPADFPGVEILEKNFDTICQDVAKLRRGDYYKYLPGAVGIFGKLRKSLHPSKTFNFWTLSFLYYMGVNMQ